MGGGLLLMTSWLGLETVFRFLSLPEGNLYCGLFVTLPTALCYCYLVGFENGFEGNDLGLCDSMVIPPEKFYIYSKSGFLHTTYNLERRMTGRVTTNKRVFKEFV